jgi:Mg2+ and Co2+ transporter CorA
MYKFVKVQLKGFNKPYSNWYLYCDNKETLLAHFQTVFKEEIQKGFSNYAEFVSGRAHISSHFGWAAWINAQMKETSFLEGALTIENKTLQDRLGYIAKGKALLLTDGVAYMPFDAFEIIEEVEKSSITYINPYYTLDDIKVLTYPGGKHYYAKVGKIDVTDDYGNQKWNTADSAQYFAKQFYEKLIRQ